MYLSAIFKRCVWDMGNQQAWEVVEEDCLIYTLIILNNSMLFIMTSACINYSPFEWCFFLNKNKIKNL